MATEGPYPDPITRRFITGSAMAATTMWALDTTIANVCLPHMQGSVSASQDEITWVLTSYIVASAVTIPLCGWLAERFGRKQLMLISVLGFTISSALCGVALNLGELVAFRVLQGIFGAALMPMSQAILFDINPPERHGQAMAVFSMGAVLAPIAGPALGGWLTDNMSWRWVFFINVPVGMITLFGLATFLQEDKPHPSAKLDLFGYAMLALAIGCLQMMLDRGQQQDWFSSIEICVEAALASFFLYAFVVQTLTTRKPFIEFALFKDRNYLFGAIFGFLASMMIFSVLALLPTMLQRLMGYSVLLTGIVLAPRGVGTFVTMAFVGPLMRVVDPRLLIFLGFGLIAASLYVMSAFSLEMQSTAVILSGFMSGLGSGIAFVPLSTLAFATLEPRLRNEAAAIYTLIRNIGTAVGISLLQVMLYRNTATVHSRLVEGVRPDNPVLALRSPDFDFGAPGAVAQMDAEIVRQASMVAYVDGYWLMFLVIAAMLPLVFLMRPVKISADSEPLNIHVE